MTIEVLSTLELLPITTSMISQRPELLIWDANSQRSLSKYSARLNVGIRMESKGFMGKTRKYNEYKIAAIS